MATNFKGLFKMGCLGCVGVLGVAVLVFAALGGVALFQIRGEQIEQATLSVELPDVEAPVAPADPATGDTSDVAAVRRVLLDIKDAEVSIERGLAGQPPTVEASYDARYFTLEEKPSSVGEEVPTWHIWFRRTGGHGSAMAMVRRIMGASQPQIDVRLPPDVPMALHGNFENGAVTGDIGGIQITELVVEQASSAFILEISEPSIPMERFEVDVRQGALILGSLGNASPRTVEIDLTMAGGVFDLSGAWSRGAEISFEKSNSGGLMILPRNVEIDGLDQFSRSDAEIPGPRLHFAVESSGFGELKFQYED